MSGHRLFLALTGAALFLAIAISACSVWPAGASTTASATLPACLVSQNGQRASLRLEVASTPDERQKGLMERAELGPDSGMLFTYDQLQPANHAFWMYHTRIPLDIAYLDESDRIAAIVSMKPCRSDTPSQCPSYPAGVSFLSALEVNQGYFRAHNFDVGDRLELGPGNRCDDNTPGTSQETD